MSEECKCSMFDTIKRIQEDMQERKDNEKDTRKDVSEIKAGQERFMYVTEQVQKAQEAMALADEKATILKKEADDKSASEDKKAADKAAIEDKKDLAKCKKAQTMAIWTAVIVMVINTIFGLFVKYAPALVGLPIPK